MTAIKELESTARALVAPGKGILAADESFPTIAKRLADEGVADRPGVLPAGGPVAARRAE